MILVPLVDLKFLNAIAATGAGTSNRRTSQAHFLFGWFPRRGRPDRWPALLYLWDSKLSSHLRRISWLNSQGRNGSSSDTRTMTQRPHSASLFEANAGRSALVAMMIAAAAASLGGRRTTGVCTIGSGQTSESEDNHFAPPPANIASLTGVVQRNPNDP